MMQVGRDEKSSKKREGSKGKRERFVFIIKNRFQKENSSFTIVNESFSINFKGAMTSPPDSYEVQPATTSFSFSYFFFQTSRGIVK